LIKKIILNPNINHDFNRILIKWNKLIKYNQKNVSNNTYKASIDTNRTQIDKDNSISSNAFASDFFNKNKINSENKFAPEEDKRNIGSIDFVNYQPLMKDKESFREENKTSFFLDKETKDIFQNTKHAQFGKNKDLSKMRLNDNYKFSASKKRQEEKAVNNMIDFDSVLSFKTYNFDKEYDRDGLKSNNRINLNQDSIVKTKKKKEKENRKENNQKNNQLCVSGSISSIAMKTSYNNIDSLGLTSNLLNVQNNIIKDKENISFNQKGNRKSNKNVNNSYLLSSNIQSSNSNSSNNDNFKFSFKPSCSEFTNNDSNFKKKNVTEDQEDDLFKILQKNVKEANDLKPAMGEKKKRFYENYLI